MKTPVDAANMALSRLSVNPISSLDQETDEAKKVRLVWESVFQTFLTAHEWSFAKKTDIPARLAAPPAREASYLFAYALPEDLLKLRTVTRLGKVREAGEARSGFREVEYEIMRCGDDRRQAVMTDCDAIRIEYTGGRVQLDDFPPDAYDALVCKLAAELALNIQHATARSQEMLERYAVAFEFAKANDAKSTDVRRLGGRHYSHFRNR